VSFDFLKEEGDIFEVEDVSGLQVALSFIDLTHLDHLLARPKISPAKRNVAAK
jgi:hypothetical protein